MERPADSRTKQRSAQSRLRISIPLRTGGSILESNKRSEGRTQIVMCASCEVDLIAGFEAQTDRPDVSFQTGTRIEESAHVIRTQILNRANGCSHASGPGIQPEIDKTAFDREERTNRAVAGNEFGAKESVQNFEVAVNNRHCWSGIEIFREGLLEVIAHLAFEHDARKYLVAHACS